MEILWFLGPYDDAAQCGDKWFTLGSYQQRATRGPHAGGFPSRQVSIPTITFPNPKTGLHLLHEGQFHHNGSPAVACPGNAR